jgi:NitT/TauT family transport system substrate-binding protein
MALRLARGEGEVHDSRRQMDLEQTRMEDESRGRAALARRRGAAARLAATTAVLVALALAACSAPASPAPASGPGVAASPRAAVATPAAPTSGPAAAATAPPRMESFTYGIASAQANYWVSLVASGQGFWREESLDVEFVYTQSSTGGTQTLVAGSVELANNSPDSAILAVEKAGADLAVVAEETTRPVYSIITRPGVQSLTELRGANLGVSGLKNGATLITQKTLAANGLAPGDYGLIVTGNPAARFAALISGGTEFTSLGQPDDFRAMAEGYPRLAVSSTVVQDFSFNSLITRREWARANADRLVRLIRGHRRASDWLYEPANRDAAVRVLASATNLDERFAQQTYDLLVAQERAFAPSSRVNLAGMRANIEMLGDFEELASPLPAPEKYLDLSYWERATPR